MWREDIFHFDVFDVWTIFFSHLIVTDVFSFRLRAIRFRFFFSYWVRNEDKKQSNRFLGGEKQIYNKKNVSFCYLRVFPILFCWWECHGKIICFIGLKAILYQTYFEFKSEDDFIGKISNLFWMEFEKKRRK